MDEKKLTPAQDEAEALARDYDLGSLFLFVLPAIFTFIFISVYQTVDGLFIEKFVGPYAVAAVNLYYPVISLLLAVGMMIGTGGNAMIVELLGRGKKEEADRIFSETLLVTIAASILLAVVELVLADPIMRLLGASDGNIEYLRSYYLILTACAPAIMLQTALGILMMGEGKNVTVGALTIVGGMLNIVLDYVFMHTLGWGIRGAALATAIGYIVPVLYGIWFYSPAGDSIHRLRLAKPEPGKLALLCGNGSSEMVSTLASGVTALFMNRLVYRFYGDMGVSVVSVFLYVQFIMMAVFMGMTTAVEPLFSYHYGNGNVPMRKKLFRLSVVLTGAFSVLITVGLALSYRQIAGLFFPPESAAEFYELTCRCLLFALPACLVTGFSIFASGLFTAFSNGAVSALLSCARTFVILSLSLFGLSALFGANGLWASWSVAEVLSLALSIVLLLKYRSRYFEQ